MVWRSLMIDGSESESNQRDREEREKIIKILNASATITVHICMITVAIMHKCTILHPLLWVFFWPKCVKGITFFLFCNTLHKLMGLL